MIVKKETLRESAKSLLLERDVTLDDIADLVFFLQKDYVEDLTHQQCLDNVEAVLEKEKYKMPSLQGFS